MSESYHGPDRRRHPLGEDRRKTAAPYVPYQAYPTTLFHGDSPRSCQSRVVTTETEALALKKVGWVDHPEQCGHKDKADPKPVAPVAHPVASPTPTAFHPPVHPPDVA